MARKNNKEENFQDSFFDFGFFKNLFRPIKILIDIHLKVAAAEFKKDTRRMLSGVISIITGCFFIVIFWLLLNVLGVLAFYEYAKFNLFLSVLIVAGINLLLSLIMFLSAKQKMKKSFMSDTKKIIEKTMSDFY